MTGYLIAHDIGTSGDKATLYRTDGTALRSETVSYPVHYFGHHCAEQNPEDWWQAVCRSTRKILEDIPASSVLGLSFSAQMQCCLPVDREGRPLHPAMIWADHRAVEERDHLIRSIGFDQMYDITGHRPNESYTLEKVMWLKKHEPDIYAGTYKILQVKDYLLFRLTGRFATDYSDASGTNAMDLNRFDWSEDILKAAEISSDLFPELHASTDIIGPLTKEAAAATGLPEGLPVVCGGGDGPCAAVGAGCIEDQQLYATFGTSAWIGGTTKEKFVDDQKILMCFAHVIPGRYAPCGTMQAAGSSYAYIRSLLEPDTAYEELDREISCAPPGSDGLVFLPYLTGERSPRWNEKASGAFIGMRMEQTRKDYLRAVIEGIGFNLDLILDAYRKNIPVERMILTGGGAKGQAVCQILADIFGIPLTVPDHADTATSIAAAVIAGVGIGLYPDFQAVGSFLHMEQKYTPVAEHRAVYQQLKPVFDECYHALEPVYNRMDALHV